MQTKNKLLVLLNFILVFVIFLLVFALKWFIFDWNTGVITAIYQLKTPLDGTNPGLITEFCEKCLPFPLFLAVLTFLFELLYAKTYKNIAVKKSNDHAGIINKVVRHLTMLVITAGVIIILIELKYLELDRYIINQCQTSNIFEENYSEIDASSIVGGDKNLVLIYAESMEITYASRNVGGGKPENLIPNLTKIMQEKVSFSDGDNLGGCKTMPGADWTMGGLFSTMTGTPLKLDLTAPNINLNESFCPKVTSVGQILANNSYVNYFQCGSDAAFGGRKAFFTQHGDYNILDYQYAVDKQYIPKDYHVFWGYEDRILFDIAKKELSKIGKEYIDKHRKFNYTMLTVDTHHPAGYRCQLCEKIHNDEFSDIVSCSDKQISDFIFWVEEQPWAKDTVIVVLGDHPSMVAGFWDDTQGYENKPINLFINSRFNYCNIDDKRMKNRQFTHFDLTPTILEAMGFNLPNHKIGLGTSLFCDEDTLIEKIGEVELKDELCKTSHYYNENILQ